MPVDHEFGELHLKRQKKRDIKKNRDGRPLWKKVVVWSARALFTLLLCGLGITATVFVFSSQVFDLKEVQLLGNIRSNPEEIRQVLTQRFPKNLYRIRLWEVREVVEAAPWVQSCQVVRVFPDRLKILIVERRPVALAKIEDELFLVDRFGGILETYGPKFKHLDLPVVRGLDNSTQENVSAVNREKMAAVMRVLAELDSSRERLSDQISEIDVTDPNRVALMPLDQPVRVVLGDSNFRERYQIYISRLSLMADLAAKYGPMDSVDLSVDHRIIFHTKGGAASGVTVKDDQPG